MSYTTKERVDGSFDEVVEQTIAALEDEGFGVLCDIEVRATFAEKLDEEFRNYRILGACNPGLAHQGLQDDIDLGALLPCNVVVYEADDGDVVVGAVDPNRLVGLSDEPALETMAAEADDRFARVLSALAAE
ncbi:DUF302 domain-containing protein [Halobacteriales archaeon Cl-PHB]